MKLIQGESSFFSFENDEKNQSCGLKCVEKCKSLAYQTRTPAVQKKDTATGPKYLPPSNVNKKENISTQKPLISLQRQTSPQSLSKSTQRQIPTQSPSIISQRQISRQTPSVSTQVQISTQSPLITSRRPTTTSKQTSTQKLTNPRLRSKSPKFSSTPGPAYLPVNKKSTPKRSTVTERSTYQKPATWWTVSRFSTETFPTWSPPVRKSTSPHSIPTTTAKYLYKEPASNALRYAD